MKDGYRIAYDRANMDLAGKLVEMEQLKRRRAQIEALVQALTTHFSHEEEISASQRQPLPVKVSSVAASLPSGHGSGTQHREWVPNFDATSIDAAADPIQARIEQALGRNEAASNVAQFEKPVQHFEGPPLFAFVS
jgi:hypothetical protein